MKKLIAIVIILPLMGFTQESILEKRFLPESKTQNTTSTVHKVAQYENQNKQDSCFLRKTDKIEIKEKIRIKKFEEVKTVFNHKNNSRFKLVKKDQTIKKQSEKENKASCFLSNPVDLYTQKMDRNILCLTSYSSEYIQKKNTSINNKPIRLNVDSSILKIDPRNKAPLLHNGVREEINRKGIVTF